MKKIKLFLSGYVLVFVLLFIYSFTQVDLSLTLSKASTYQTVEKVLQHVGYFERPLATELYICLLVLLFGFYISTLVFIKKNFLNRKQIWMLIIAAAIILAFSYNAFSYDLFNYIFDAKIITHYQQNPYQHFALQYPGDPMLSFMHWTQRTYPYGPLWLLLSVPISFLGGNIFLLTFFMFKMFICATYILTAFFLEKIIVGQKRNYSLFGLAFFALNPLTIIESVVSAHNDIVMILFAVLGLYFFINKKWILAVLFTVLSPLVKQATVFLPFVLLLFMIWSHKKKSSFEQLFTWCVVIMAFAFLFYVILGSLIPGLKLNVNEIQPWYFLWILPFVALFRPSFVIVSTTIGITLGMLLRYAPFLWQGDWNGSEVLRLKLLVYAAIVGIFVGLILQLIKKIRLY